MSTFSHVAHSSAHCFQRMLFRSAGRPTIALLMSGIRGRLAAPLTNFVFGRLWTLDSISLCSSYPPHTHTPSAHGLPAQQLVKLVERGGVVALLISCCCCTCQHAAAPPHSVRKIVIVISHPGLGSMVAHPPPSLVVFSTPTRLGSQQGASHSQAASFPHELQTL